MPISLKQARRFTGDHHRHNLPPRGWLFGVAAELDGTTVGVGIAGRPVARVAQDGRTLEVIRVTTLELEEDHNLASRLYGALCRAGKALGYRSAITYTLASEAGTSVRAAGFEPEEELRRRDRWRYSGQVRVQHDLFGEERRPSEAKVRWRRAL